jgi:glycosyltransferase involved in cell wall biosynthesis
MLKVLIDTGNAPPHTGIGSYSYGLLYTLMGYHETDFEVTSSDISINTKFFRPLNRLIYLARLNNLSKRNYNDADVIHFTNVYVPKRNTSVKYISTIHDIDAITHPKLYSKRYYYYFLHTIKQVINRADLILTVTEASKNIILEKYKISSERIKALGIGISRNIIDADIEYSTSSDNNIPIVLYVGALAIKKNTDWLIETFTEGIRSKQIPHLQLVLAGNKGFGFEKVERNIKLHGEFVHWVENPDFYKIAQLYKSSNVVVLPSKSEGFGIPLIEAMYFKKPIVASNIPSSLEVASEAACFFELDDKESFYYAINKALKDTNKTMREKFIDKHLKYYQWDELCPKYIQTYKEVSCR